MELKELYQQIQEEGLHETEAQVTGEGSVWTTYMLSDHVVQAPRPGEETRIPKNTQIYERLKENGVSVPRPKLAEEEPPAYAIFDRIDGHSIEIYELLYGRESQLEAFEETGRELAQTHQVETQNYGCPIPQTKYEEGCFQDWSEFLKQKISQIQGYLEDSPFQELAQQIEKQINYEEIPEKPESTILHNDLHKENIIVNSNQEVHLIDFDNAMLGDPRFDLIKTTQLLQPDEEAQRQLIQGYRDNRSFEINDTLEEQYELIATLQNLESAEATRRTEDINVQKWLEGFYDQLGLQMETSE